MIKFLPPGGESTNKLSVMFTKLANQSKLLRFHDFLTFTIGSGAAYLNHLFPDGLEIGWTQSNLMIVARAFGWKVVAKKNVTRIQSFRSLIFIISRA